MDAEGTLIIRARQQGSEAGQASLSCLLQGVRQSGRAVSESTGLREARRDAAWRGAAGRGGAEVPPFIQISNQSSQWECVKMHLVFKEVKVRVRITSFVCVLKEIQMGKL